MSTRRDAELIPTCNRLLTDLLSEKNEIYLYFIIDGAYTFRSIV